MIQYRKLNGNNTELFTNMTFPAYRHLLNGESNFKFLTIESELVKPCIIGAYNDNEPIALALAGINFEKNEAELLSLFVINEYRNKGIGCELLLRVEEEIRFDSVVLLTAVYMTGSPGTEAVEHIIEKCGWEKPYMRMASVRFNCDTFQNVPWLNKYKNIKGYDTFLWKDITNDEKNFIQQSQKENPWIPDDLVPWLYDKDGFEPTTSLGIKYKGDIVGWIINHKHDNETLRVTCGFIRVDLGKMGLILPASSVSFNLMRKEGFTKGMFTTPIKHPRMISFIKNWIAPWTSFIGETRGASKHLSFY
ncbi:MAG: GNAT family N-acetyltransferase [Desulfobacterales bacterium]|nr:GNAT family N-acetyltransferase [Desulfobacterales bacterium]